MQGKIRLMNFYRVLNDWSFYELKSAGLAVVLHDQPFRSGIVFAYDGANEAVCMSAGGTLGVRVDLLEVFKIAFQLLNLISQLLVFFAERDVRLLAACNHVAHEGQVLRGTSRQSSRGFDVGPFFYESVEPGKKAGLRVVC